MPFYTVNKPWAYLWPPSPPWELQHLSPSKGGDRVQIWFHPPQNDSLSSLTLFCSVSHWYTVFVLFCSKGHFIWELRRESVKCIDSDCHFGLETLLISLVSTSKLKSEPLVHLWGLSELGVKAERDRHLPFSNPYLEKIAAYSQVTRETTKRLPGINSHLEDMHLFLMLN